MLEVEQIAQKAVRVIAQHPTLHLLDLIFEVQDQGFVILDQLAENYVEKIGRFGRDEIGFLLSTSENLIGEGQRPKVGAQDVVLSDEEIKLLGDNLSLARANVGDCRANEEITLEDVEPGGQRHSYPDRVKPEDSGVLAQGILSKAREIDSDKEVIA